MTDDEKLRKKLKTVAEKVARQLEAHERVYRDTFNELKLLVDVWHEKHNADIPEPRSDLQTRPPEELAQWVKNNVS